MAKKMILCGPRGRDSLNELSSLISGMLGLSKVIPDNFILFDSMAVPKWIVHGSLAEFGRAIMRLHYVRCSEPREIPGNTFLYNVSCNRQAVYLTQHASAPDSNREHVPHRF